MLGIEGWTGWVGEFQNCLDRILGIEGWVGEFLNCLDRMLGIQGWTGWVGLGSGFVWLERVACGCDEFFIEDAPEFQSESAKVDEQAVGYVVCFQIVDGLRFMAIG
jgi:hypothetical protein